MLHIPNVRACTYVCMLCVRCMAKLYRDPGHLKDPDDLGDPVQLGDPRSLEGTLEVLLYMICACVCIFLCIHACLYVRSSVKIGILGYPGQPGRII